MDAVKESNVIYSTTDYSKFKKMRGNRGVQERRVRNIVKSIERVGWISNPIIVNKQFEVVDGQGRLEALKRLGLPVEYHIVDVADVNDCRQMNSNLKGWTTLDYVQSYADGKVKDYQRVKELMDTFDVTFDTVMMARGEGTGASGRNYEKVRDGEMDFTEADYVRVCARLNIHKKYYPIFKRFGGHARIYNKVIFFLIRYAESHDGIDHDKIIEALENTDPHTVMAQSFDRLLESVQNAYNYNKKRRESRLYFYEEYRMDTKVY